MKGIKITREKPKKYGYYRGKSANGESIPVSMDGTFQLMPTRLTVVEAGKGRVYEKYDADIFMCMQDDGKTLKLFIEPIKKDDYLCMNCDKKVDTKRTLCCQECHDEFYEGMFDSWN